MFGTSSVSIFLWSLGTSLSWSVRVLYRLGKGRGLGSGAETSKKPKVFGNPYLSITERLFSSEWIFRLCPRGCGREYKGEN